MRFLETRSGLIRAGAIDSIGGEQGPPTQRHHIIEYHVGNEARETRATAEAVADFLSEHTEVPT